MQITSTNAPIQNTNPNTNPNTNSNAIIQLCIPRIETTITSKYIKSKLENTPLGYLKQYTEIPWKQDPQYKRVLIRIQWKKTPTTLDTQPIWKERLYSGQPIHLVYDYPNIWKIYLAKN